MLRHILDFVIKVQFKIISIINKKYLAYYLERCCLAMQKYSDYFVNYNVFPKKEKDVVHPLNVVLEKLPRLGIVIQGPLCENENFTIETVKLYKKIFQNSIIIVSTWSDSDEEQIKRLEAEKIVVLRNTKPSNAGILNINYQVHSSLCGLIEARKLGCEYVIKTRTDQRIYRKNLYEFLYALIKKFPVKKAFSSLEQNERIVVLQGTTNGSGALIPGFESDHFFFGHIDDIINFFETENMDLKISKDEFLCYKEASKNNLTVREFFSQFAPEVLLVKSYLNRNGVEFTNTAEQHITINKNYFIGLSWNELGLFWYKYDYFVRTNKLYGAFRIDDNEKKNMTYDLDFNNWFILHYYDSLNIQLIDDITKQSSSIFPNI